MTLQTILADVWCHCTTADEAHDLIEGIMWAEIAKHVALEREACAKVCENFNADHQDCNCYDRAMAAAIRARGEPDAS